MNALRITLLLPAVILLLAGCASTKPPAKPSPLRVQADRTVASGHDAFARQNWSSAAQLFAHAATTYAALDDPAGQADALHNRAQASQRAGQIDAAIDAYEAALALNRLAKRNLAVAQNLAGLAQCARAQSKFDLAIESGNEALTLAAESPAIAATIENDLALHLLARGNPADKERIFNLLSSALQRNQRLGNKHGIAANDLNFGRAHLAFHQLEPAEAQLARALLEFKELDDVAGLAQTHEQLAKLYQASGDNARARHHQAQARDKYAFVKDEAALRRLEAAQ